MINSKKKIIGRSISEFIFYNFALHVFQTLLSSSGGFIYTRIIK